MTTLFHLPKQLIRIKLMQQYPKLFSSQFPSEVVETMMRVNMENGLRVLRYIKKVTTVYQVFINTKLMLSRVSLLMKTLFTSMKMI